MDFKHEAAGRVKKTIPGIPSGSAHAAPLEMTWRKAAYTHGEERKLRSEWRACSKAPLCLTSDSLHV